MYCDLIGYGAKEPGILLSLNKVLFVLRGSQAVVNFVSHSYGLKSRNLSVWQPESDVQKETLPSLFLSQLCLLSWTNKTECGRTTLTGPACLPGYYGEALPLLTACQWVKWHLVRNKKSANRERFHEALHLSKFLLNENF